MRTAERLEAFAAAVARDRRLTLSVSPKRPSPNKVRSVGFYLDLLPMQFLVGSYILDILNNKPVHNQKGTTSNVEVCGIYCNVMVGAQYSLFEAFEPLGRVGSLVCHEWSSLSWGSSYN